MIFAIDLPSHEKGPSTKSVYQQQRKNGNGWDNRSWWGCFAAAINSTITYFNTKSFMISLLVIYKHHHHDKKSYVDTGDDAKFCPARASHANGLSDKAKATTRPKHFTVLQDDEETTMSFGNSFNGGRTRMVRVFDPM
jgi:hypothetical protein